MEHWLPLFHERLDTVFDYLPGSPVVLEALAEDAAHERFVQIADYYEARRDALKSRGDGPLYQPLPPDRLYLNETEFKQRLAELATARLTPFATPDASGASLDIGARQGRGFAAERAQEGGNVFDAVREHVQALQGAQSASPSRCGATVRASA
jgi:transcription-repair coupling factor (superfamily II helicase)